MNYCHTNIGNVDIEVSSFQKNDVNEIHLFAKATTAKMFDDQIESLCDSLKTYMATEEIPLGSLVFMRLFVSDYANQSGVLSAINERVNIFFDQCAVSIVQQPPLNGNKIVAWAYIIQDPECATFEKTRLDQNSISVKRGDYEHIWSTQLTTSNGSTTSADQTWDIFTNFNNGLEASGYSLKENCIRTWLFVTNIDFNYPGVVDARRLFFKEHDMTDKTHFIASTGIEGRHAQANINVLMDAYSVGGIQKQQIKYLQALENLNPTYEYGVTFERGTSVDFGDRRHIYISGTASINNKGEVVYQKDVSKQVDRIIENIDALLNDADASMADVAQLIIYLRDVADSEEVEQYFAENYQDIPKIIVLAPVCRPGWLVEMECVAIKSISAPQFGNF